MWYAKYRSEGDQIAQKQSLGKFFDYNEPGYAEVFYSASCNEIFETLRKAQEDAFLGSKRPLVVHYCWDFYQWAIEDVSLHYFNHSLYLALMRECDLILVPSKAQQKRLLEFGVKSEVVRSGVTCKDWPESDKGFILDPLRFYPVPEKEWAIQAADELGIPMVHSEHGYKEEDWWELRASCTFTTCCVPEASTGSLTLVEALWHGKPALVSASPYQGAAEYMGPYCTTFTDYEDLKQKMKAMWEERRQIPIKEARTYIKRNLTYDIMARNISTVVRRYLKAHRRKMQKAGG